jgi:hypothetical protein
MILPCLQAGAVAFLNMVWMKSLFIFEGVNVMLSWELYVSLNVPASSIVVDILKHLFLFVPPHSLWTFFTAVL